MAFMAVTISNAQDITDAVRYSSESLTGTARFTAMSGAFGALGGDLSALNINPAGSAVFLNSYSTFTLSYNEGNYTTGYFNGLTTSDDSEVLLDQAGAVFVFLNKEPESNWGKLTLGINYSTTNNFRDSFVASGVGSNSIDQYFLGYADGVPLELLETVEGETVAELYQFLGEEQGFGAQQALLGYQGFILNPVSTNPDNTNYISTISPGTFDQEYSLASTGMNGKFSFNLGTEFQDFLYLGANLNTHFLNYERATRYLEVNDNAGSETNEILFSNNLSTTGNGFSFQLGTIAKVNEMFRVGVAYESPTWYTINEESFQALETYSAEFDETVSVVPNIMNIYPDYKLKTPGKLNGSLAVLFGNTGLLSFDYSYRDFSQTELRPKEDPDFMFQNSIMEDNLKAASTYRVGGEYRIENWSLRAGYRFEESPYKNETTIGELTGYSAGLGYNFGNIKLDLAYSNANRVDNPQLYQVGLTNTANIDRDFTSVVLSLSFGI